MKKIFQSILVILSFSVFTISCSSNPNKAEKIDTKLDNKEDVGGGQALGINDKGEMVVQNKVRLATYLHDVQVDVYSLETDIYGDESVGRSGLYGVLRDCKDEARSKKYGGDSKVSPPPDKDIKTASEDMSLTPILEKAKAGKIGKDENKQLVGVSEDFLTDRIKRFEGYKSTYQDRKVWFQEEIRKCQTDLSDKKAAYDASQKAGTASAGKSNE